MGYSKNLISCFAVVTLLVGFCAGFTVQSPHSTAQPSVLVSHQMSSYDDWELSEEDRRKDREHRRRLREEESEMFLQMADGEPQRESDAEIILPVITLVTGAYLASITFFMIYVPSFYERYTDERLFAVLKTLLEHK